jgi:hypothetical protein
MWPQPGSEVTRIEKACRRQEALHLANAFLEALSRLTVELERSNLIEQKAARLGMSAGAVGGRGRCEADATKRQCVHSGERDRCACDGVT